MKHFIVVICFLMISGLSALQCLAQTKQMPEVSVDLGSGVVSGALGLPFDVPFRISGTTTSSLRKISLTYSVSNSYGCTSKLQWLGNALTTPSIWNYVGDQKEWRLPVGPIHPNVPYDFIFTITRIPDVKAPEKEQFKEAAYNILEEFYDKPGEISDKKINETNTALNVQVNALIPPGQKIIYPNGNNFIIDLRDPPFSTLLGSLKVAKNEQWKMETKLKALKAILTLDIYKYDALRLHLGKIITSTSLLTPDSKAIIDEVIDAGNTKYKTVKMIDIGKLVIQPTHRINEVFEGKLMFDNHSWTAAQKPDIDLMQLVYLFYSKLIDNLEMASGGPAFNDEEISIIKDGLLPLCRDIIATRIYQLNDIKKEVLDKFPDVLADKWLSATYIVNDQSYIDAVSQSTPYIGLDVGLSYIPGYSQLFIYEGVNFYFTPVNKDTPLSYFRMGRYWWLKRLSIHMGLTQSLIKVDNKRYIPLIEGVGSLMVGAGLRINRIMRINTGYMFFYEKDNNPLIDKKHFTALPQFSFTFDLDVAKALGNFGKRLGVSR